MKRLFKVRYNGKCAYFEKKTHAKEFRDDNPGTHVSNGPDHIGKHGKNKPKKDYKEAK